MIRPEITFDVQQRMQQVAHFDESYPDRARFRDADYRFVPEQKHLNLAPTIREAAWRYFDAKNITWHTHANHALSSQVCCLNFLMPLAEQPKRLACLVGLALGIEPPDMLPVEDGPDGHPWFIGFEWNGGGCDYLNESLAGAILKRGSNSTSADAFVRFQNAGQVESLLIEWKYTEQYGAPIKASGNATRTERYKNLVFAPGGPIRSDLGLALPDFFYEPFYQLLRQQMLAFQMQMARQNGAERVRVLHISPSGNRALHRITSPGLRSFGDDAFQVFQDLLVQPDQFVSGSTEKLFGPLIEASAVDDTWASYLIKRYRFLSDPARLNGSA
jgi:hypothetical protein